MYLFRFEAELAQGPVAVIVVSEDEQKAFSSAEVQLEKHFVAPPTVDSLTLVEKKRIERGSGFVIE